MPYWNCYYHIVWATKHRQPTILPAFEQVITAVIQQKSLDLKCTILAINMVSDHIHVAVRIPPSLSIATWVGHAKGVSARSINTDFQQPERFHWQEGYGVMTFGEKALEQVKEYIANQKQRHASRDLNRYLERSDDHD
jgi:putative transposase